MAKLVPGSRWRILGSIILLVAAIIIALVATIYTQRGRYEFVGSLLEPEDKIIRSYSIEHNLTDAEMCTFGQKVFSDWNRGVAPKQEEVRCHSLGFRRWLVVGKKTGFHLFVPIEQYQEPAQALIYSEAIRMLLIDYPIQKMEYVDLLVDKQLQGFYVHVKIPIDKASRRRPEFEILSVKGETIKCLNNEALPFCPNLDRFIQQGKIPTITGNAKGEVLWRFLANNTGVMNFILMKSGELVPFPLPFSFLHTVEASLPKRKQPYMITDFRFLNFQLPSDDKQNFSVVSPQSVATLVQKTGLVIQPTDSKRILQKIELLQTHKQAVDFVLGNKEAPALDWQQGNAWNWYQGISK